MGEFGWAYISGSNISAAQGTDGSVQLREAGSTAFSGSASLTFDTNSNLNVTGAVLIQGRITASSEVSASVFYGDGSNLSGIGSGLSISSDGPNRILTSDGDNTLTAESNLTFDGTSMVLSGTLNVSGAINANEYNVTVTNQNVINLTATGSTKFGDTTNDKHVFTGSLDISASTNPIRLFGLQSGTPPNSSSYVALDSNYRLVLTSAAGGSGGVGGTIGAAEDGTLELVKKLRQ